MAKILSINDEKISVGQDDGKLIEVPVSELSFVPSIGQEVDVFVGSDNVIVTPTENAKAKNTSKGSSKKIYHKWYFWVIIIVIVGGIGFAAGNGGKSDTNSNSQSSDTSQSSENDWFENEEETDTTPKVTTPKVGEEFDVGDVTYCVNSVKVKDRITTPNQSIEATPKRGSKFIIVDVTMINNSDKPITISTKYFKLKLGSKTFKAAKLSAQRAANWSDSGSDTFFLLDLFYPADVITGNVVFEASPEVLADPELQMQVKTGLLGKVFGKILGRIGLVYLNK